MAYQGTILDMVTFCKAWEELEHLIEGMPLPERHRGRELMGAIGRLTVLNVDISTAYGRWVRGMPEHAGAIEEMLRRDGYGPALDGF